MQGKLPSFSTEKLIALIQKCRQEKSLHRGKLLLAYLRQHRLDAYPVIGSHLVPMLVDCGCLPDAQCVFDRLPLRAEHAWTSLISGYIGCGESQHAFALYHQMQQQYSVPPSKFTYLAVLSACTCPRELETGHMIHAEVVIRGFERELYVGTKLVDMYSKCGFLVEAHTVFDRLSGRSTISWNALIAGYAQHGPYEGTWNFLQQMQMENASPDLVTFICSLKACSTVATLATGQTIHAEIMKRGLETELLVGNTLVDMYCKCNSLTEAHLVFETLPARDAVSWAVLITGYTEHGLDEEALTSFQQMQCEGVFGDVVTFQCCLKACGMLGAIETLHEIHFELVLRGSEKELSAGTTLTNVYSKCGLLAEANRVFQSLPAQNLVSWNALLSGYVENGLLEEARSSFQQIQSEGLPPNLVTVLYSLKACSATGTLEKVQQLHSEAVKRGFETELCVGNMLVDVYLKNGSFAEAHQVFDMLPLRDGVTWAALIAGCLQYSLTKDSSNLIQKMQLEVTSPNIAMFVWSLKVCGMTGDFVAGQALHTQVTRRGLERDLELGNSLVDMYTKYGSLTEAQQVFDELLVHNTVSWAVLIAGYAEHQLYKEAVTCFQKMQLEGFCPDSSTYTSILKACATLGSLERGQEMHAEVTKRGLGQELCVANTLVSMYSNCASVEEAHHVFDRLAVRDAVLWTALLEGYACCESGEKAIACLHEMQLEGISPDSATFVCSLKLCRSAESLKIGQAIHANIMKKGLEREHYVGHALVDMYTGCGLLAEACEVFDRLPTREVCSWNAVLAGYAEHGLDVEVLNCFTKMQLEGVPAGADTCILCLKACAALGALETGQVIHSQVRKLGLDKDVFIGNILIDMYGKCGLIAEGQQVFSNMPIQDVVSWTAMIKAYGENHETHKAMQCFEDMQVKGVKPDSVTFICLLAACSHASLIQTGWEYYKLMTEELEMEPTLDHYACVVDLLARSGQVHEAERYIAAMHCPPSNVMLVSLLSACRSHGKVEEGQRCFNYLVELKQDDASAYLLLGDLYASSGRWSDAQRVEEIRTLIGAKKPGNALIELNKRVHSFIVGVHPSKDIRGNLETLSLHMVNDGHVPDLDLVLSDPCNNDHTRFYEFMHSLHILQIIRLCVTSFCMSHLRLPGSFTGLVCLITILLHVCNRYAPPKTWYISCLEITSSLMCSHRGLARK